MVPNCSHSDGVPVALSVSHTAEGFAVLVSFLLAGASPSAGKDQSDTREGLYPLGSCEPSQHPCRRSLHLYVHPYELRDVFSG